MGCILSLSTFYGETVILNRPSLRVGCVGDALLGQLAKLDILAGIQVARVSRRIVGGYLSFGLKHYAGQSWLIICRIWIDLGLLPHQNTSPVVKRGMRISKDTYDLNNSIAEDEFEDEVQYENKRGGSTINVDEKPGRKLPM